MKIRLKINIYSYIYLFKLRWKVIKRASYSVISMTKIPCYPQVHLTLSWLQITLIGRETEKSIGRMISGFLYDNPSVDWNSNYLIFLRCVLNIY